MLGRLREEFSGQIDVAVEKRVAELNQLLKEIQPAHEYNLVFGRSGSRNVLLKQALQQAQHRLILVCPWPAWGVDFQVIQKLEVLLQRNVYIDIGWGRLKDIDELGFSSGSIRQRLKLSSDYYSALPKLEALEQKYSKQLKLKLLGTHEKFLVCDDRFAMLGSHNFLTSGTYSAEREVGLRTNDPRIIADLIKRFDDAKNLELTEPPANSKPTPQIQTYSIPDVEADVDDIPFVRPVSYGSRMEMFQDLWEIEVNRPSKWLHGK